MIFLQNICISYFFLQNIFLPGGAGKPDNPRLLPAPALPLPLRHGISGEAHHHPHAKSDPEAAKEGASQGGNFFFLKFLEKKNSSNFCLQFFFLINHHSDFSGNTEGV